MGIGITWLGHSTVVVDIDETRVITDPLLKTNNAILRRRSERPTSEAWTGTQAILLSHLHHDHAELASLRLLGDIPVITAPANAAWAVKHRLYGIGLDPGIWFHVGRSGDVEVSLTPAVHHARPMPHRPNAANGHLVRSGLATVWLAGDTELFAGLVDLPRQAGGSVDIAVVPIGGWGSGCRPDIWVPSRQHGRAGSWGHAGASPCTGARCTFRSASAAPAVGWIELAASLLLPSEARRLVVNLSCLTSPRPSTSRRSEPVGMPRNDPSRAS